MPNTPKGVTVGNAGADPGGDRGWFLGHFIKDKNDPLYSEEVEMKWDVFEPGPIRAEWGTSEVATTFAILFDGEIDIEFPDGTVTLSTLGDYALHGPGLLHKSFARKKSTVLAVRWPSKPGDSGDMKK